jgi:ketosteroid isomerase-like protein
LGQCAQKFVSRKQDMTDNPIDERELVLRALHAAWSAGKLDKVMGCLAARVTYTSNVGEPDKPFALEGKQQVKTYMQSILASCECASHVHRLEWRDGSAHARIGHVVRHKASGHELCGTFRQIARFRGSKICHIEEYYDAAKLMAFVRLIGAEQRDLDEEGGQLVPVTR